MNGEIDLSKTLSKHITQSVFTVQMYGVDYEHSRNSE